MGENINEIPHVADATSHILVLVRAWYLICRKLLFGRTEELQSTARNAHDRQNARIGAFKAIGQPIFADRGFAETVAFQCSLLVAECGQALGWEDRVGRSRIEGRLWRIRVRMSIELPVSTRRPALTILDICS